MKVWTQAQAHGAVAIPWECQHCFQGEGLVLVTATTQEMLEMFSIYNDNKKTIAISWNIYSYF